jgi:cyanophycin synthetase
MKIRKIKVLRGPNYWSNYRKKLIEMELDLEDLEDLPTNRIDGFCERLQALMPSLHHHHCSEGKPGGFFQRVKNGTWIGHVIEHIALELQSIAGMDCGFGRTRSAHDYGVYHVVFSYQVEQAGVYAGKAAVSIAASLVEGLSYDLAKDISALSEIKSRYSFGPSTKSIIEEADRRNIPWRRMDDDSLVMLGHGNKQKIIRATVVSTTSSIGVEIASDKEETKSILRRGMIPIPDGIVIENKNDLKKAIEKIGFPVVIKPLNGNHGNGVTTNINSHEHAEHAFTFANEISDSVIIERYLKGNDYRFLVINYKLAAVAKRTPAKVIGDNSSTIAELIQKVNSDENRGDGHEKILTKITIDENTKELLIEKNLSLNSIVPFGEIIYLKSTANLSTGGTAKDMTDHVHPFNIALAERIARLMNLDICGIDIVAEDIDVPVNGTNGGVIEVNAGPGFRMHLHPSFGNSRNVAKPVIDMLFPNQSDGRIPLVAVTGTNGKTTCVGLTAHIAAVAGKSVGHCSTVGLFIDNKPVHYGDCSGPGSAEAILMDPIVDYAVLECARGGILRSGLGFDQSDISIVTNISEDHLGLEGIYSIRQLAQVKEVVARSTKKEGYCILNADDEYSYNMRNAVDCNVALFSMTLENERLLDHIRKGGIAAFPEDGFITIISEYAKIRLAAIDDIPITYNGTAGLMIKNILPSVLAAYLSGFSPAIISQGLKSFYPSPECNPGRMNLFTVNNFEIMVDYVHNPAGLKEIKSFIEKRNVNRKFGIISIPGDRRDDDILSFGSIAAEIFDEIIIRCDGELRGRSENQLHFLIRKGIEKTNPYLNVTFIANEYEALSYAGSIAGAGDFIFLATDMVTEVAQTIEHIKNEQSGQGLTFQNAS